MATGYFRLKKNKFTESSLFIAVWLIGVMVIQLFLFIIVAVPTRGYGLPILMMFCPSLSYYLANKVLHLSSPPLMYWAVSVYFFISGLIILISWIK